MALTHLPRLHLCVLKQSPSSLNTHVYFNFFSRINYSAIIKPKSTLSTTEPIPLSDAANTHEIFPSPEKTQIQISLDKLFVPPETKVSVNDTNLSTRILKGSNIVLSKYARDAQVVQAEFVKSSVR